MASEPEKRKKKSDDAKVEEADKESFPASDAPSWNMGAEKRPHRRDPADGR
jgi:hypothetical protein